MRLDFRSSDRVRFTPCRSSIWKTQCRKSSCIAYSCFRLKWARIIVFHYWHDCWRLIRLNTSSGELWYRVGSLSSTTAKHQFDVVISHWWIIWCVLALHLSGCRFNNNSTTPFASVLWVNPNPRQTLHDQLSKTPSAQQQNPTEFRLVWTQSQ